MSVIDTLQVIIEADARGIQSTLKDVLNTGKNVVGEMNKQEVDWTSIFARTISPAIISGVASMFALAIANSMSFQESMATTGTAAGETAGQIGQMGTAALDLSQKVPASAQDIATSMTQVGAVFANVADQQEVVQAMAELAASGFGSLNDITKTSVQIFKEWGVTTTTQAVQVLTQLMHGAEAAKESIPALGQQFLSFTPQLIEGGMHLNDFNKILATFSATVKDVGADQAQTMFTSIATGASDASSPMAIFGGGVEGIRKSLMDNGGLSVIQKLAGVMSTQFGDNVGLIAKSFGLSATEVEGFINAGKNIGKLGTDAQAAAQSTQTIKQAYNQSDSALRELLLDWNKFMALLTSPTIANAFQLAAKGLGLVLDAERWAIDHAGDFYNAITNPFGELEKILPKISGLISGTFSAQNIKNVMGDITGGIKSVLGIQSSPLNSALQKTGVGFSDSILGRIDQTASQNGLIESLTSALQSGIKGGQYTQLVNTFHLNVPSGGNLNAQDIAKQLYAQFQGV